MTNVPTDSLDVKGLLAKISIEVETLVHTHLKDRFKNIAVHIANVYDLPPDDVLEKICAMTATDLPSSDSTSTSVKKRAKPNDGAVATPTSLLCSMNTKAGSPCKYKRLPGVAVCKKHQTMHEAAVKEAVRIDALPTEEQAWFADKAQYTESHYPAYKASNMEMDEDIIDDSHVGDQPGSSSYVTDE
jgi:hypothetical protein